MQQANKKLELHRTWSETASKSKRHKLTPYPGRRPNPHETKHASQQINKSTNLSWSHLKALCFSGNDPNYPSHLLCSHLLYTQIPPGNITGMARAPFSRAKWQDWNLTPETPARVHNAGTLLSFSSSNTVHSTVNLMLALISRAFSTKSLNSEAALSASNSERSCGG